MELGRLPTSELDDEQLFWAAYEPSASLLALVDLGSRLDGRIAGMHADFHERFMESGMSAIAVEEQRVVWALQDAREHVNHAYGSQSGHDRVGCNMGAQPRYRSTRLIVS